MSWVPYWLRLAWQMEVARAVARAEVDMVVEVPVNPLTPWTRLADANAPAEVPPSRSDAPEDSFELQWVFGNSASAGMRKSAAYTGSGAVLQVLLLSEPEADAPAG
jgi:hypothetical protein